MTSLYFFLFIIELVKSEVMFASGLETTQVFWNFFRFFIGFLGFNVHNAEHRYMTHDK